MAGMGGGPPDTSEADERSPYTAEEDVGETVAWCSSCEEERRFVKSTKDVASEEEAAAAPDVRRAMSGEEGYRCTVCGRFEPDLITERNYDWQMSDVGYHKRQFPEEPDTTRAPPAEPAEPPGSVPDAPAARYRQDEERED